MALLRKNALNTVWCSMLQTLRKQQVICNLQALNFTRCSFDLFESRHVIAPCNQDIVVVNCSNVNCRKQSRRSLDHANYGVRVADHALDIGCSRAVSCLEV